MATDAVTHFDPRCKRSIERDDASARNLPLRIIPYPPNKDPGSTLATPESDNGSLTPKINFRRMRD